MKIWILSDLHEGNLLEPTEEFDVILTLGDIHWKTIKQLDEQYKVPKLGVLGNHDRHDTFVNTQFINLHQNEQVIQGLRFAGFEGALRYNEKIFGQHTEKEAQMYLKTLDKVDVFAAHSNPTFESNKNQEEHLGFLAFGEYIEKKQPRYFFHGHLHKKSREKKNQTQIYSVYPDQYITIFS